MIIVTEEMKFRQRLCEYAIKHGVTKAARRYHTNRQFVYRQLEKYDGSVRSLALRSRKPQHSPNAHTEEELKLIKNMLRRNGRYGLAEVYVRCQSRGYSRSFESMCRQIRKNGYRRIERKKKSYTRYENMQGTYPGEKVQIDVKEVPYACLRGALRRDGKHLYQWTAIDECTRIRFVYGFEEHTPENTVKFLKMLIKVFPFSIKTIQTDNGTEFTYKFISDTECMC